VFRHSISSPIQPFLHQPKNSIAFFNTTSGTSSAT
jgi:hypothetical protein